MGEWESNTGKYGIEEKHRINGDANRITADDDGK